MVFSSLIFLYLFLPAVILCYFLSPKFGKNFVLLAFSLFFYAWGGWKYLPVLLASVGCSFVFGWLLEGRGGTKQGKVLLILSCVVSLGLLGIYKYTDFVIGSVNSLLGTSLPLAKLVLPIGISFYTFQMLSYTIDVYRGSPAQHNFIDFAAYVTMFPQLIAGPIVRYDDVALQLRQRRSTVDGCYDGAVRFMIGLGKKVLLANNLALIGQEFRAVANPTVLYHWLYAVSFTLQIYFDFSGYSDMAIGLGKIFGFTFPENFNYPYISASITEFWRRWHMTLSTWFRDYVYIPLGGNRVSKLKNLRNIAVVWLLTGLWHGAGWNFILWGLLYAVLLMAEKLFLKKYLDKFPVLGHIYTLFFVIAGFVLFNAESLQQCGADLAGMFMGTGTDVLSLYALRNYGGLLLIGILCACPLGKWIVTKLSGARWGAEVVSWGKMLLPPVILLLCTAYLVDGSFNPFLYFRF